MTVGALGGAVTESRWLIQPVCSSGRPAASAPLKRNDVLPNSPRRTLDLAAEVLGHQLHAVADAEHGDAELVEAGVDLRRVLGVDRGRPAGEDHRGGVLRAREPRAVEPWPTSSE